MNVFCWFCIIFLLKCLVTNAQNPFFNILVILWLSEILYIVRTILKCWIQEGNMSRCWMLRHKTFLDWIWCKQQAVYIVVTLVGDDFAETSFLYPIHNELIIIIKTQRIMTWATSTIMLQPSDKIIHQKNDSNLHFIIKYSNSCFSLSAFWRITQLNWRF